MGRASCSVLLAGVLAAAACEPPPAPPSSIDAATMSALLQRLDRLTAALEDAPGRTVAAARIAHDVPPERTAAAGDPAALQARISALEAELAVLRSQPAGNAARTAAFGAAPVMRQASVQGLKELRTRDETQSTNEALRSVFLLGPAEVLERFGTPSFVVTHGNGACGWVYRGEHEISIVFAQGAVIRID
jgi:hypothetical protein